MYAGLDFGTSSCSIGVWREGAPRLIPLEGTSTRLPSALYTTRPDIQPEEIDEAELKRRLADAKRKQSLNAKNENKVVKQLSDPELENIERGLMKREIAKRSKARYENQTISEVVRADTDFFFGDSAIRQHIEDPKSGYFVQSPKSYLGSKIKNHHVELFTEIIYKILDFIRYKAEFEEEREIRNIVLGRPVNFHGNAGEKGNAQAINILHRAAIEAGFKDVEFFMEPVAAALDFEQTLSKDLIALVLDAGGGTTDCSMVKLGPSYSKSKDRSESILGYSGVRVGGKDLDIKLALKKIMPFFGKESLMNDGLPIPNTLFWNAVAINDVNAQEDFFSLKTMQEIVYYLDNCVDPEKLSRLKTLCQGGLTSRLNQSSEHAKIGLSDTDSVNISLPYIDPSLSIPVSRNDFRECIERELRTFISLMKDVEVQAATEPDVIYVTGGTAKSPVVQEWIRSNYRDIEIVAGDSFGSVVSGLTTRAYRIYG